MPHCVHLDRTDTKSNMFDLGNLGVEVKKLACIKPSVECSTQVLVWLGHKEGAEA